MPDILMYKKYFRLSFLTDGRDNRQTIVSDMISLPYQN